MFCTILHIEWVYCWYQETLTFNYCWIGRNKQVVEMGMDIMEFTLDARQYLFLSFPGKGSEVKNFPSDRILMPSSAV